MPGERGVGAEEEALLGGFHDDFRVAVQTMATPEVLGNSQMSVAIQVNAFRLLFVLVSSSSVRGRDSPCARSDQDTSCPGKSSHFPS